MSNNNELSFILIPFFFLSLFFYMCIQGVWLTNYQYILLTFSSVFIWVNILLYFCSMFIPSRNLLNISRFILILNVSISVAFVMSFYSLIVIK